jgi:hypothetical protein
MPGLVPGIHALLRDKQDVDGRDKPGHDAAPFDFQIHYLSLSPATDLYQSRICTPFQCSTPSKRFT